MLGKFFIIPTYRISPILSTERWMMSLLTRFETSVLCVHSRDLPHKLCIYVSLFLLLLLLFLDVVDFVDENNENEKKRKKEKEEKGRRKELLHITLH